MPLPLLSCCISSLGQKGLLHNRTIPSNPRRLRVTLASRGNSASKNLQQDTQWPKCCLYESPYVAALLEKHVTPLQELCFTHDFLQTYLQEQEYFWFTSNAFLMRPVLLKYWLLHPFSTRKPHAKAVPRKDYFTHLTLKNARKVC